MGRPMKDSGVEWIGEIPADWEMRKISMLFQAIGSGTTPKTSRIEYYEDEDVHWLNTGDLNNGYIWNTKNKVSKKALYDHPALRIYPENSVVIAMYGATIGQVGITKIPLVTNQACCVLSEPANIDEKFIYYWFIGNKSNIINLSRGSGQPNISKEIIRQLKVSLPSHKDQQIIADYLDQKSTHIDSIIEKTKASIAAFKRYKQALITETVTKGLEPDVPMKDSGIEWIGMIPEHWEAVPLKKIASFNNDSLSNNEDDDLEINYVDIGSVSLIEGIKNVELLNFKDAPSRARRIVKKGDIIVSTVRTYLKAIASIEDDRKLIVSTGFAVIRPQKIESKYLSYYLKSDVFTERVKQYSYGVAYPSINTTEMSGIKILEPSQYEQFQIAAFLDEKTAHIDRLIQNKEAMIEKLEAYKKSLIYEYVTGKKEVE